MWSQKINDTWEIHEYTDMLFLRTMSIRGDIVSATNESFRSRRSNEMMQPSELLSNVDEYRSYPFVRYFCIRTCTVSICCACAI
jgi:hypothetical protein